MVAKNRLDEQVESDERKISKLRKEIGALSARLREFDLFDLSSKRAEEQDAKKLIQRLEYDVAVIELDVTSLESANRQLAPSARPGWNPAKWLSSSRLDAKGRIKANKSEISTHDARASEVQARLEVHRRAAALLQNEISAYLVFDREGVAAEIRKKSILLTEIQVQLDRLKARKEVLDKNLREPLATLDELRGEYISIHDRLQTAEDLEDRLGWASNGYERKLVHEECERVFGESRPRRVLHQAEREIKGVSRNIEKVEARVEELVERAARPIDALVIDGSNLCYQGSRFIGLVALREACSKLTGHYAVTVVFDASIRAKLCKSDNEIDAILQEAAVHVVGAGQRADETILSLAEDPQVFIVSNDRYVDFREKGAVKNDRIIRHNIVGGRIMIHELGINESFYAGMSGDTAT